MSTPEKALKSRSFSTRFAFIWMQIATEPFVAFYTLLLFILRKDLHATALQISVLATLRPVLSVLSPRVPIRSRDRLLCDSFAMADQPRSLDRSRLGDGPLTTLSPEELAELERALLGVLGIGLA